MTSYVSFDPGERTGITTWRHDGTVIGKIELREDDLDDYFCALATGYNKGGTRPLVFIYEKFLVRPDKAAAFIGSELVTIQVIGKIKLFAKLFGIKTVGQHESVRKVAALWSGTKIPKGHMPNRMSAYLHGYHYLHQHGIITARVLKDYQ